MAWTGITRAEHERDCRGYLGDLSDREWQVIAPLLPAARTGERRRSTDLRAVLDVILHVAEGGIAGRGVAPVRWTVMD